MPLTPIKYQTFECLISEGETNPEIQILNNTYTTITTITKESTGTYKLHNTQFTEDNTTYFITNTYNYDVTYVLYLTDNDLFIQTFKNTVVAGVLTGTLTDGLINLTPLKITTKTL